MTLLSAPLIGGYETFWPVIIILVAAGLALSVDLGSKRHEGARMPVFVISLLGVLLAFASLGLEANALPRLALGNGIVVDAFGLYLCGVILAGVAICCMTSLGQVAKMGIKLGDYLTLVLVSASGMMLLVTSNDLIMIFLSVELMSLGIYVLAGVNQKSARSAESAMKYLVMGAFASGFLLLGLAIIYGVTGHIRLPEVAHALQTLDPSMERFALLGAMLVLIGFLFKVGAVPFHQWVPDVYTGAPTPVTGLMSVAVKTAAFGAFGRFVLMVMDSDGTGFGAKLEDVLWLLAAVSVILGNWLALAQSSDGRIKRMLAYSGVAHSGYLVMGLLVAARNPETLGPVVFYLAVYTFATAGAFAVISFCSGERELDAVREFKGLAWRRPGAAAAMTIFMLSSAGIPLTGGFLGKYWLFSDVVSNGYIWLALLGILGSMIGAYYYLKVVVYMYMKTEKEGAEPAGETWGTGFSLKACAVASVLLGVAPLFVLDHARDAADGLAKERTAGTLRISPSGAGQSLSRGGLPVPPGPTLDATK